MTAMLMALVMATGAVAADVAQPADGASTNSAGTVVIRTARLRNPFWPIGYEDGELEAISDGSEAAESAATVEAVEAAAAARLAKRVGDASVDEAKAEELRWQKAVKLVKVGGVTRARTDGGEKAFICINGRSYARGDRLAVDDGGYRFVWEVRDFDDVGHARLARVRSRSLEAEKSEAGETL